MISAGEGLPGSQGCILIDTKKCQGCLSCMLACSLVHEGEENMLLSRIQVVQNSFEKYPHDITVELMEKCDLCNDTPFWHKRAGPEENQACVAVCPVGALRFFEEMPSPGVDGTYDMNFRGVVWKRMGYPID